MKKLHSLKRHILTGLLIAGTGITSFISTQAHAEYMGFPTGRSANIPALPDSSVEAGFVTGDVAEISYQHFGTRFNLRISPELMGYADVAQVELEDGDGLGYGAGFFYHIPGLAKSSDFAVKVSFHTVKTEEKDGNVVFETEGDVLSIEGLFSGEKIGESNLNWYTNFGIHKFDFVDYDESEIGFGGGVFSATSFGEFYAGADLIDELTFGLGVRYHLR